MNGAEKESLPPEGAPNDGGQGESISESTVVGAVVDGQGSVVPALDAKETSGIEGDVAQHKKTYDIKEDEQKALQNQQRLWEAASLRGKYGDLSTSLLAGVKIKPLVDKSEVHLREERVVADVLEELMAAAPERGDAKGWVRLANKHLESAGSEDKMSTELQALRTLLEEENSLEETVVRIKNLRGEIAKLKLREQRFAVDPLLRRRPLKELPPEFARVLVASLQNELSALRSVVSSANCACHPALSSLLPEYEAAKKKNLDVLFASVAPQVCDGVAPFVQQSRRVQSGRGNRREEGASIGHSAYSSDSANRQLDRLKHEAEVAREHISRLEASLKTIIKIAKDSDVVAAMRVEGTCTDGANEEAEGEKTNGKGSRSKNESERAIRMLTMQEHNSSLVNQLAAAYQTIRRKEATIQGQLEIERDLVEQKRRLVVQNVQLGTLIMSSLKDLFPDIYATIVEGWQDQNIALNDHELSSGAVKRFRTTLEGFPRWIRFLKTGKRVQNLKRVSLVLRKPPLPKTSEEEEGDLATQVPFLLHGTKFLHCVEDAISTLVHLNHDEARVDKGLALFIWQDPGLKDYLMKKAEDLFFLYQLPDSATRAGATDAAKLSKDSNFEFFQHHQIVPDLISHGDFQKVRMSVLHSAFAKDHSSKDVTKYGVILAVFAQAACEIFDRFRKMDSARKGAGVSQSNDTNIRSAGQVRKYLSQMFCHLGLDEPVKRVKKKSNESRQVSGGTGGKAKALTLAIDAVSDGAGTREHRQRRRPYSARPRLRGSLPEERKSPRRPHSGTARFGSRAPHRVPHFQRSRSATGSREQERDHERPESMELSSTRSMPARTSSVRGESEMGAGARGWDLARRQLSIVKRSINGALQASEDMRLSADIVQWMARSVPGPNSPRDASGTREFAMMSSRDQSGTASSKTSSIKGKKNRAEEESQPGGAVGFGFASTPLAFVVLAYDRMLRLIFTRYAKVTTLGGGASGHTFEEHARAAEFITQGTLFRFMSEFSIIPSLLTRKKFFEMMNGAPRLFRAEDFVARLIQCASLPDVADSLERLVDGAGLTAMKALFLSVAREAKTSGFREVQDLDPDVDGGMDAEVNRSIKIPSQMVVAALQSNAKELDQCVKVFAPTLFDVRASEISWAEVTELWESSREARVAAARAATSEAADDHSRKLTKEDRENLEQVSRGAQQRLPAVVRRLDLALHARPVQLLLGFIASFATRTVVEQELRRKEVEGETKMHEATAKPVVSPADIARSLQ